MNKPTNLKLLTDKELLSLVVDGDERAFERLFGRYATPLAALAGRMLRDDEAKQEVIQEVFLKIWLSRDRLEQVQQFSAWIRKMTINECLMYLRRTVTYKNKLAIIEQEQPDTSDFVDPLHIKELRQAVDRAISAMPPQRRTIYELSRSQGLTAKEIATQLNLSHGYVRNALSAALTGIRQQLSPYIDISLVAFLLFFHRL